MVTLYDNETGAELGAISDEQFAFLRDHLEEESTEDTDYYIMSPTVDLMESAGGEPSLIALLRAAIGTRDGIEIRYAPPATPGPIES